jgi:hypothetical protein
MADTIVVIVEPVPRRRMWRVECQACDFKAIQTTKAFALERAKLHRCDDPTTPKDWIARCRQQLERVDL